MSRRDKILKEITGMVAASCSWQWREALADRILALDKDNNKCRAAAGCNNPIQGQHLCKEHWDHVVEEAGKAMDKEINIAKSIEEEEMQAALKVNDVVRNKKGKPDVIGVVTSIAVAVDESDKQLGVNYINGKHIWEHRKDMELASAEPEKKPWPQDGDTVYQLNDSGVVTFYEYLKQPAHESRKAMGYYRTSEYAEWMSKHQQALVKLRKIAERDYEAGKIDWRGEYNKKYLIFYAHEHSKWGVAHQSGNQEPGAIYFHKEPDLDHIKKEMGDLMSFLLWKPEVVG